MSIQAFYSNAIGNDFARLFQFRIIDWTINNQQVLTPDELIYAETAALPGRAVNNIPVPYMGLSFNVPGTVSFPGSAGWAVTFRCDQNYNIRSRLENFLVSTYSAASTSGNYNTPGTGSQLTMALLGKTIGGGATEVNIVKMYQLHGTYLVSLADTAYDVKDTGTVSTINATIAYQWWSVLNNGSQEASPNTASGIGANTIRTANTFSKFQLPTW